MQTNFLCQMVYQFDYDRKYEGFILRMTIQQSEMFEIAWRHTLVEWVNENVVDATMWSAPFQPWHVLDDREQFCMVHICLLH